MIWGGAVTASLLPEPPKRGRPEADLQRTVVRYLRLALPLDAVMTAIEPGGKLSGRAQAIRAGMGHQAGWPDLLVVWRGLPIGLELKTASGGLSAVQKQMHQRLGYARVEVVVCRSLEQAEAALRGVGIPLSVTVGGAP